MSRRQLAMVFVIAKSGLLFAGSENPFSPELVESAMRIAIRVAVLTTQAPTPADEFECIAYIKSQPKSPSILKN